MVVFCGKVSTGDLFVVQMKMQHLIEVVRIVWFSPTKDKDICRKKQIRNSCYRCADALRFPKSVENLLYTRVADEVFTL